MIKKIEYKINRNKYDVIFTSNIAQQLNLKFNKLKSDKKILFVYDEKIPDQITEEIRKSLKTNGNLIYKKKIKSEKKNKNIKVAVELIEYLSENNFTKKSVLVACGGGVIGDLCGLVSSLYLRGMIFINIPTTMTSIVDSCIGGKTAINHNNIINLIGTYYHPSSVFIYNKILNLLPDREYIAGLSEIIKCSLISNSDVINKLKKNVHNFKSRNDKFLSEIILKTLKTKANFFINDVSENNKRLMLNFGHTFAHAFEMATDKNIKSDYLRHGEAVSLGILSELHLSKLETKNKSLKKDLEIKINECTDLFKKYGLPCKLKLPSNARTSKILTETYNYVFKDKKKISDKPRYIKMSKKNHYEVSEIQNFDNINLSIHSLLS